MDSSVEKGPFQQRPSLTRRRIPALALLLLFAAGTLPVLYQLYVKYPLSGNTLPIPQSRYKTNLNLQAMEPMFGRGSEESSPSLADAALNEILARGAPILGVDAGCTTERATCDWMAKIPDQTKLVHMNLPGTHDTATWNYTDARQAELERYTGKIPPAKTFRCQQRSIFGMLNDGIRVFDMRYAYNPGNDTIGFYHSRALLAPTTTLSDVLFGFYYWLERHPTETVLLSFNHEGNTGTVEDERLQRMILDTFSAPSDDSLASQIKRRFWVQERGVLGTLGESRGKAILLQRFSYSRLSTQPDSSTLIGLDLGADRWTDNGDNIALVYNKDTNATAFIEDRYAITLDPNTPSSVDAYITSKFNYTTAHLERATQQGDKVDQLFISFASAAALPDPSGAFTMYPVTYALGEDGVRGMNERLLEWFEARRGQGSRFGAIMLDFYDAVPGLIEAFLDV